VFRSQKLRAMSAFVRESLSGYPEAVVVVEDARS
jgi:hypothetical protein